MVGQTNVRCLACVRRPEEQASMSVPWVGPSVPLRREAGMRYALQQRHGSRAGARMRLRSCDRQMRFSLWCPRRIRRCATREPTRHWPAHCLLSLSSWRPCPCLRNSQPLSIDSASGRDRCGLPARPRLLLAFGVCTPFWALFGQSIIALCLPACCVVPGRAQQVQPGRHDSFWPLSDGNAEGDPSAPNNSTVAPPPTGRGETPMQDALSKSWGFGWHHIVSLPRSLRRHNLPIALAGFAGFS
ncbi:hypothetical protein F5884DRAFT_271793 [Xylogone sp. PMI_703]|nr:hypothetical protein F5884DRAFT_271793 [Xylogone sp. PMI_703]